MPLLKVTIYKMGNCYYIQNTPGSCYADRKDLLVSGGVLGYLPQKVEHKSVRNVIDKRGDLSPNDYQAEREKLKVYESDGETWTIDSRHAIEKFDIAHPAIYREDVTWREASIEVFEIESERELPPYTRPCRLIGAKPGERHYTLFQYKPNLFRMLSDASREYGFKYVECGLFSRPTNAMEWAIPDHGKGQLKFIQTCKGYAPSDILSKAGPILGTISECAEKHKHDLAAIHDFWRIVLASQDASPIAKGTKDRVANLLLLVKGRVQSMSPKRKDTESYETVLCQIDQLLREVSE